MTSFSYKREQIKADALTLDYILVPWDTEIIGEPVAEIRRLEINDPAAAVGGLISVGQMPT